MNEAQECWIPIMGYEGLYDVSTLGNVRSHARDRRVAGKKQKYHTRTFPGRVLRLSTSRDDYLDAALTDVCGNRKRFRVHTLVADAFLGPKPPEMVICRLNGNKLDNRVCNLKYLDRYDQNKLAQSLGTRDCTVGENNASAVLTESLVKQIREFTDSVSCAQIVKRLKLKTTRANVHLVRTRQSWKHVK